MALQIDDDWKKQAQEEKRKLAEEAKAREEAAAAAKPAATPSSGAGATRSRELPPADFTALVQTMLTQAGYYLGEYAGGDGEPVVDLDGAKFQMDLLAVVEDKTKNNITPAEQAVLDAALYELRSRYVSIATQMIR